MASVSKSIPFVVPAQPAHAVESITQLELELLLSLRNRSEQLKMQIAAEEETLRLRLESGATIEPGVHVADRKVVPDTFLQALQQGWKVSHDTTCLSIDKRHRDGTVTLTRAGFSKLFVPYTASVKRGLIFGRPRIA